MENMSENIKYMEMLKLELFADKNRNWWKHFE